MNINLFCFYNFMRCISVLFFLALSLTFTFNSRVVNASNSLTFTVRGTVVEGPGCIVNNNNPIDVNFGDALKTTDLDGVNYVTSIPFSLQCTNSALNLRIQFVGKGSSFDAKLLSTNYQDLGIRFLKSDNTILAPNEWLNFNYMNGTPIISAVPVKRQGAILPGGTFNSTATLLVELQ